MAATQTGTAMDVGQQGTLTNYTVLSKTTGGAEVDKEEFEDEAGALKAIAVYRSLDIVELELEAESGATPEADFPIGTELTSGTYDNYFVDDCRVVRSKTSTKASVTLRETNLTA